MNEIHVLDNHTVDKIAAGEVVERPFSIVKELVENAIDAGAGHVTVEIKDGGISMIRVTDDGSGIDKSQLTKAFLRHATSKIKEAEDLSHISSLGFRGEALSSIAAVCQVELITKTEEELTGWGCTITRTASGNIKTAMQDGTGDITVDHPPNNQANTVELTLNTPCTLWDLPESVRDYMESKGWTKTTWKAGTSGFTGHDEDIQTVSSSNVVVCRRDLDEEVVYLITKAICESGDELAAASSALAEFDPSIGWVTMEKYMHPGAIRYYKEMGYMP